MTTTNVLQISGFAQIPYRIFILPPTNAKSTPTPSTLANDLRRAQIALLRRGELVNIKNGELWTFSRDGIQSAPVPDESSGLQEISTGTLFASQLPTMNEAPPQAATTQTFRNGPAHEHFLSAVRALAEFRFLQIPGYQILGNWLVPPSTDDLCNDGFRSLLPALYTPSPRRSNFKLSVNLAANGDLYITPEQDTSIALQPVNTAQPPMDYTPIFLSPSGQRVEFLSLLPSNPQTSSVLQKIRSTTGLEANFPLMRVRLASGVETLWPANLCFQRASSKKSLSTDSTDYFNLKDGVSSAVKLISDALTYKPPPTPSPAIPPAVIAHVTPSGVYHTPPDGIIRTKPLPNTAQTPTINQTSQEDWNAPAKEEEFWMSMDDTRGDDDEFMFDGMNEDVDLREEDFDFFDDEPSGEHDAEETLVSDVHHSENSLVTAKEEKSQPMEDVKVEEKSPTPAPVLESRLVSTPPSSPLRILPSPPPTRRGTFPKIWDHVRLSGNLEKVQDKYRRGGKYWCGDLNDDAVTDDSISSSSSDDEGIDLVSTNPRKRKRDDDEDLGHHKLTGASGTPGPQNLASDVIASMIRVIDENLLLLQYPADDLFKPISKTEEKHHDYAHGLDANGFNALVEVVANQVSWDGLGSSDTPIDHQIMPIAELTSVIAGIWGTNRPHNPGLKELTEVIDIVPSDEEDSPQIKTPRMKVTKSSHTHNSSFSLVSNIEQTQSIYPIPPPPFLVHRVFNRNDPAPNHIQRLSVSPPALRFWEKFSFSPVVGEKDVQCYVVHPDSEGMASAVETFLSEIQTTWETCGMGNFERGKVHEGGKDGMVAIQVPPGADDEVCLAAYQDSLHNFGRGLATLKDSWLKNILILMVNPFANGSAVIPLCRAFLSFKSTYFEGADNPSLIPASNVALQIVPVEMVAKKEGVVMRGLEFQSFLRNLYERCDVMDTPTKNIKPASRSREFLTSPATVIAAPPPNTLEFNDSFPVQHLSLLKDNSSLHIAYSISVDGRWVTAVWTDDRGHVSLKESYCLSRLTPNLGVKSQQLRTFESVCALIWQRTLDIAKQARINWRVIIVRVGGMSKNEIGIWNSLSEGTRPDFPTRIQLLLACIDLNPPLTVSVPSSVPMVTSPLALISTPFPSSTATFSQSSPAAVGNAYGTPVATPLAQANESPDPSGGIMSTPGGTANAENVTEFDPEARWVDAGDEVWAIVLNHRVPTCHVTDPDNEIRFALASGYLWPIKSIIPDNLIQVHLVHVDKAQSRSSPPPEILASNYARDMLKQLLSQYRGLASLGVVRGVSLSEKIVPWHVIAAERIKDVFAVHM